MSMDSFDQLFTFFNLAAGGYCLYVFVRLLLHKTLFQNSILIPSNKSVKDCLDAESYIQIMKPLFLVFGLFVAILALFNLADKKWGLIAAWFPNHTMMATLMSVTFLPLTGLVIFAVILTRTQKKYF